MKKTKKTYYVYFPDNRVLKFMAHTKSEARGYAKKYLDLKRLPKGTVAELKK